MAHVMQCVSYANKCQIANMKTIFDLNKERRKEKQRGEETEIGIIFVCHDINR